MKKSFGIRLLLVCLLLLTMLNASYAVADDVGADDRNPSNDIVIVLDQSNSMSNADPQNRLDAAQMIVGMCDMENSRVAIIPFAGKIQASADMGFVPINEAESRLNKMNAISGLTRLVGCLPQSGCRPK